MKGFLTDYNNGAFWEEKDGFREEIDAMRTVRIFKDKKYQTIKGFGGALTQASGYNYSLLPDAVKEDFIRCIFSEEGLNYNLGRVHINSCDFALGNYAYLENADDPIEKFDISIDEKYIFPMLNAASKYGEVEYLATPWSPPAFMKTNSEMNHGGQLKKEYYGQWAEYIVRFIEEYEKRGTRIRMLTVQNEPAAVQTWDSCIYSATEEGEFVAGYLGPALEKAGLGDIKIFVWDHNKEALYDRAKETLDVPGADRYVSGFAFHWYTGDHFDVVAITAESFPGKELIFTEGCVEYSRFADSNEVRKAEMYAHDMIGNLNAGAHGIIDWNILLDAKGGPNHVGNFCAAPVMTNEDYTAFEKRLSYYYIGHMSKFIKKGAKRLGTSRFTEGIDVAAFENPDGDVVCVLMNKTENAIGFSLTDGVQGRHIDLPAHSIMTVIG
ncbi:MAG: glucosylceramidase [Lachnospiraceae bacterium]|nr:glucosylceramidase [Lachnospiraceae bacterium]